METKPSLILVAAAALIGADSGCVLMQRRNEASEHGGLWEFPGGKCEPWEAPEAALVRELSEELGLIVDPATLSPIGFASGRLERPLVILLYAVPEWQGEPQCLAASEIAWFKPIELAQLAMPPLDYGLAEALLRMRGN